MPLAHAVDCGCVDLWPPRRRRTQKKNPLTNSATEWRTGSASKVAKNRTTSLTIFSEVVCPPTVDSDNVEDVS